MKKIIYAILLASVLVNYGCSSDSDEAALETTTGLTPSSTREQIQNYLNENPAEIKKVIQSGISSEQLTGIEYGGGIIFNVRDSVNYKNISIAAPTDLINGSDDKFSFGDAKVLLGDFHTEGDNNAKWRLLENRWVSATSNYYNVELGWLTIIFKKKDLQPEKYFYLIPFTSTFHNTGEGNYYWSSTSMVENGILKYYVANFLPPYKEFISIESAEPNQSVKYRVRPVRTEIIQWQ